MEGLMSDKSSPPTRKYPPLYEKLIPVALVFLAIVILGMLVYTVAVGIGVLNFG
jgi:hypothetical protein